MKNRTECDTCGTSFTIKLKVRKIDSSVQCTYFKCPECNGSYVVAYLDKECRKLQKQLLTLKESKNKIAERFLTKEFTEEVYIRKINNIENNYKRKHSQLKYRMNMLKNRYIQ